MAARARRARELGDRSRLIPRRSSIFVTRRLVRRARCVLDPSAFSVVCRELQSFGAERFKNRASSDLCMAERQVGTS